MKLSHLSFLIVLGFVIVSARGDGTNRAGQIFSAELAQEILGGPVEASSTATPDTEMGKTWVSRVSYRAKTGGVDSISVSLLIRHANSAAEAKQIFESSKGTFQGEDVSGLGDAAYRTKKPAQLNVLKGVNWLIISAGTFRDPDLAAQETAAREILSKMPK